MLRRLSIVILAVLLSWGYVYAQTPVRANSQIVQAQTGTSYPIINADAGKLLTFSNGSPVAVSIAQAGASSLFKTGWFVDVENLGAGTVTITPATSTIGGNATLVLTTGQTARINSNGTNYLVGLQGGGGSGIGGSGTLNTVPKFTPNGTTVGDSRITDDGTNILLTTQVNGSADGEYIDIGSLITEQAGNGVGYAKRVTAPFPYLLDEVSADGMAVYNPYYADAAETDLGDSFGTFGGAKIHIVHADKTITLTADPTTGVINLNASAVKVNSNPVPTTATDLGSALDCSDAGSTDAYVCTVAPTPTSLTKLSLYLTPNTTNTGAATINANSLGVKNIKKLVGASVSDPADGDLRAGGRYLLTYDGTQFLIMSTLGNAAGGGITNGAGNNVITKSNGTNLVASGLTDDGTTITTGEFLSVNGAGANSERFGAGATAAGSRATALGIESVATGANSVALGDRATVTGTGVAIGVTASSSVGIAIGAGTVASASVAIGSGAVANEGNGTAVAIGYGASSGTKKSIVLGRGNTATADGQFIVGTDEATVGGGAIQNVYIGGGITSSTPVGVTYHGTGGSGSNIAGGNVAIAGGISTGAGAGGNLILQSAPTLQSSGSSVNTLVDRLTIVAPAKTLTSASAVSLFDVSLPTLGMAGGTIHYTIEASDGTDMIAATGDVDYAAVNKGGVYTTTIATLGTEQQAKSSVGSTIADAFSIVSGTNKITVKITSTVTGITPTTFRINYQIINNSPQAITPL